MSTCPVTIHALLHIAGGIEMMGPVWAYWAFPMERFCGKLLRCIKSRRHPFANIDSYITAVAQLDQIKNRYNAHNQLDLLPQKVGNSREFAFEECKCFCPCSKLVIIHAHIYIHSLDPMLVLGYPRQIHTTISQGLLSKIIVTLVTRYNTTRTIIKRHLSVQDIEIWGKIRRLDGGDTMRAAAVGRANAEDKRDASYVRVSVLFCFLLPSFLLT